MVACRVRVTLLPLPLLQKALQLPFHSSFVVVLVFFLLVLFSGQTAKCFIAKVLTLVIKKVCDQDLTYSLDTPKNISVKCVLEVHIYDACGTWHGLCTVTNIHSIQKSIRNSQKLGKKLASRWQKIQGPKQRKIQLISLKVKNMLKKRNWLLLYVKQHKNCCWKTCVIRKCTYRNLHSGGWWSWWRSYVGTYHQHTN